MCVKIRPVQSRNRYFQPFLEGEWSGVVFLLITKVLFYVEGQFTLHGLEILACYHCRCSKGPLRVLPALCSQISISRMSYKSEPHLSNEEIGRYSRQMILPELGVQGKLLSLFFTHGLWR